jgi:hypothetical protein
VVFVVVEELAERTLADGGLAGAVQRDAPPETQDPQRRRVRQRGAVLADASA